MREIFMFIVIITFLMITEYTARSIWLNDYNSYIPYKHEESVVQVVSYIYMLLSIWGFRLLYKIGNLDEK